MLKFAVDEDHTVSGLLAMPRHARAIYVVAPGAGAGMEHPFMAAVAESLADRRIATFRYQFPYMERGSKRPDRPALAHAAIRGAVDTASRLAPSLPLFAGGKSFGGRMTSQAQAEAPLPSVSGLVFLGFPLHPANKPSDARAEHLTRVTIPMLFLQGTRDALADLELLKSCVAKLGDRATLMALEDADHSFHVPKRSRLDDAGTLALALDNLAAWIEAIVEGQFPNGPCASIAPP